jgi:hypothetical protein
MPNVGETDYRESKLSGLRRSTEGNLNHSIISGDLLCKKKIVHYFIPHNVSKETRLRAAVMARSGADVKATRKN